MASTVIIDKAYFDTLLGSARQYANLRRNLFRGGIAEATLAVLIKDDAPALEDGSVTMRSMVDDRDNEISTLNSIAPSPNTRRFDGQTSNVGRNAIKKTPEAGDHQSMNNNESRIDMSHDFNNDYEFMPEGLPDHIYEGGLLSANSRNIIQRPVYEKHANRTVQLINLPESVTHEDIVDVVRGGQLLDVFLRPHDRIVHISFLEESSAQGFFRHVKRYDLYVKGKRVDIRWNDRQFILPGHVARNISVFGATRNLVIQKRSPRHTEELIRDDLEHIHNLVIIKVTIDNHKAYISTNSVHNAMYARTCMMSRTVYRGAKVEWDDDECAAPLERPQQNPQEHVRSKKQKATSSVNRFQLLKLDGSEDVSADDEIHNKSQSDFRSATRATGIQA